MELARLKAIIKKNGCPIFLGMDPYHRRYILNSNERSVLALGPSRSGKTSGLVIPAVLAHPGPVVCTSTKTDIIDAVARARASTGTCWQFGGTGYNLKELNWSPVQASNSWENSLFVASFLVNTARPQKSAESYHWNERAEALIACGLHAAYISNSPLSFVIHSIFARDLRQVAMYLEDRGSSLACSVLSGLLKTEDRELSGIFSTASGILSGYKSDDFLKKADNPNFDPDNFVESNDTIFIASDSDRQQYMAPLVVSLLEEIKRAAYHKFNQRNYDHPYHRVPVLFALDELAHTAPLFSLESLVAEGGGQGVLLLGCFQDLSQASKRFGGNPERFINLFPTKVIFPGIIDRVTVETISLLSDEIKVPNHSFSRTLNTRRSIIPANKMRLSSITTTYKQERLVKPEAIRQQPPGTALIVDGSKSPGIIKLASSYNTFPFNELTRNLEKELLSNRLLRDY
jgi:type IV secretion system protein VirD4